MDGYDSPSERTAISEALRSAPYIQPKSIWKYPRRYLVALLAFLGFCNLYALRVNLSVGIVAMTSPTTVVHSNGTIENVPAEFDWDSETRGVILASFFYGYIVPQVPAGYLAAKFGGRRIFGIGVAVSSVLTIFTPLFARTSWIMLVAARVVEGLFEGVTYPAIHAVWARWAPPLERSKLATIAFSGSYFGTVIALPVSGMLADTCGWPAMFIFFGIVGLAWSIAWSIIVTETPSTDRAITEYELDYIRTSLGSAANNVKVVNIYERCWCPHKPLPNYANLEVPWRRIFTSFPVWAIIIAHFSENWGFYTLLTELPTLMQDLFGYNLKKAGELAALPYLAMGLMVQLAGYLADCLRANGSLTTGRVRKMFNCTAFMLQAIFLLSVAHSATPVVFIICLTAAVGFGGFAWAGFGVNHLDIAPPYASILMGVSNTFATLPGMISPILTGHIVQNKSWGEWQAVFYMAAAVYVVGALLYGILASGDEQQWARLNTGLLRDDESSTTEDLPYGEASCD